MLGRWESAYLILCMLVTVGASIGCWVYINILKRKKGKDE